MTATLGVDVETSDSARRSVGYVPTMPFTVDPVVPPGAMSETEQPTLSAAEHLQLRPFEQGDTDAVIRAFADPDISFWHGFRVENREQALAWIDNTQTMWSDERGAVWAAVDTDGRVLGRTAMYTDLRRGTGELAYWVLPEARRRSVAVRCAVRVTQWAHESLGLHRVLLQHSVENAASQSVARRAGFAREGIARQQDLHDDGWHDMQQHGHLAGDGYGTMGAR